MKKATCYLCEDNCVSKCLCGFICKEHNAAFCKNDSCCVFCFHTYHKGFIPTDGMERCTFARHYKKVDIKRKQETAKYWMLIAPKLNIDVNISKYNKK